MLIRVREDGSLVTYIKLDGDAKQITLGQPLEFSAPGTQDQVLTSQGAGTPATFEDIIYEGKVGQIVQSLINTPDSATTIIPYDNSIPQNTEGFEFTTLAITPINASSELKIEWILNLAHDANNIKLTGAVFKDSETDALHAQSGVTGGSDASREIQVSGVFFITSGTTSSITFKLRVGGSSSGVLTRVNVDRDGNALFGSKGPRSGMIITEILP
jgi:hypothetical protein